MSTLMAVGYVKHGRLHYADPGRFTPAVGDQVVVGGATHERVATVLWPATVVDEVVVGLPVMTRMAGPGDIKTAEDAHRRGVRARTVAKRLVREQSLPMVVVGAEFWPSDQRVTVWFTAPARVDFRDLLRTLSRQLSSRVLLTQLGDRERAKLVGGVGVCGRELCCSTFLDKFEPISMQMARDQDLPTDPLRLSGACGRLMCCLRYEHPAYVDFTARPPSSDGGGCSDAGSCGSRAAHDTARGGGAG